MSKRSRQRARELRAELRRRSGQYSDEVTRRVGLTRSIERLCREAGIVEHPEDYGAEMLVSFVKFRLAGKPIFRSEMFT